MRPTAIVRSLATAPLVTRFLIPFSVAVVLALAVGRNMGFLPSGSAGAYLVAPVFTLGAIVLFAKRATWSVVALVGMTILGLYRYSTSFAGIDMRLTDLPYIALVAWAIRVRRQDPGRRAGDIGQHRLGLFAAVVAISLLPTIIEHPAEFTTDLISWSRLIQTLSLVWLLPYVLRQPQDQRLVINSIAVFGALEIMRAIFVATVFEGTIGGRLEGVNGPNATGLIAGLVLLLAAHSPTPSRRGYRIILVACGLAGLGLSRSNGAAVATAVAFGVFGITSRAVRLRNLKSALTGPARLLLLGTALVVALFSLRPENLPGSEDFGKTSSAQRLILGTAGVDIFLRNPIIGVGWQRSSLPEVIGTPDLSDRLRQQFPRDTAAEFFPDQNPTNVHNAYIQVLAEAGAVGFAALASLLIVGRARIRRIVGASQAHPWYGPWAAVYPPLILCILVWWNDNALFGAQPETILLAILLGSVRAIGSSLIADQRAAARQQDLSQMPVPVAAPVSVGPGEHPPAKGEG